MNTILKRIIMFLVVLIVFIGFLLNYIYRSSKADRITTNEEYIEQLKNASAGKKLPGSVISTYPTPVDVRPIESFLDAIFSWFRSK